ncbi:MAG: LysR substrate-binding domain-containing protein [Symbiopectobacterium sp.]|uniref:LysR substrate-binding domain-containing protein n=1 Tax=Symbiopectobacterium sp. TaxID=2952789 RepID=UPI003F307847
MDSDSVVRYRLFSEGYFIITPPDYRKRIRTIEDLRELSATMSLVRFNRNSQIGMQIERYLRRIDIRVPNQLEFDNADTLTAMVAAGFGWAVTTPISFNWKACIAVLKNWFQSMPMKHRNKDNEFQ